MARQRKSLPARSNPATDDSLLIRSAESLGRMIGSLQRQLDAARRLTLPSADTVRGNGHAPERERTGSGKKSKTKTSMKKKPTSRRSATKRGAVKSAT